MRWHDLLFAHWPVEADVLRPLIPRGLELDTFDGRAWVGIVPFYMTGVRPRYVPELFSFAFPELNVRTYVKTPGRPGVWFFSLDASSRLAVRAARMTFGLPYFDADMKAEQMREAVKYQSNRTHKEGGRATFKVAYRPTGPAYHASPGTLDHWLTERYALYTADPAGRLRIGDIHHRPWPLQPAQAEFQVNTMTHPLGIHLPDEEPVLHFSRLQEMVAWKAVIL